jgi:DNA replication protein DnaC
MYRRKLEESDVIRMRLPKRHWEASFESINNVPENGDPPLKDTVKRYFEKIDEMTTRGVGLLLYGKNGTGKTSASCVVLKEMRRRAYSTMFVEAAELKSAVFKDIGFDDNETLWERMKEVDVLVIDDIGKGMHDNTGAFARIVDELIRHRSSNCRITWATTNMNLSDLEETLKISTMHALKEAMVPIRVSGRDLRAGVTSDIVSELNRR